MGRLNSALSSLADKGHFASNKVEAPKDVAASNTQEANNSKNEQTQPQLTDAVDGSSDSVVIEVGPVGAESAPAISNQDELQLSDVGDVQVEIQLNGESSVESSPPEDTVVNSAPDRRGLKDEAELTSGTDGIEYLKDKLGLSDELLMAEPEPSRPEIENYVEDENESAAAPNLESSTSDIEVPQASTPVNDRQTASATSSPEINSAEIDSTENIDAASPDEDALAPISTECIQPPSSQEEADGQEQLANVPEPELDPENQEIMQLVEQVLGIRPDLRIDNSAPIEEQLAQLNELLGNSPLQGADADPSSLEDPNASIEIDASTYDEGVTIDFGESDAAYEVGVTSNDSGTTEADEDPPEDFAGLETYKRLMAGGFGIQNEQTTPEQSADTASTESSLSDEIESTGQIDGDSLPDEPYQPVMEAWANIDQPESNSDFVPPIADDSTSPITIDVEDQQPEQAFVPPLTDDEALDELSRQVEDVSQSSILGDLTSPDESGAGSDVPEPVTSISINVDETGLVNELPPPVSDTSSTGISRRESKPKTISGQIASQDVGAETIETDSGSNLVPPSDYEIKLASKMVNSEFGEQVQGLAEQIMAEVDPDQCQILMFVGMEQNRQRARHRFRPEHVRQPAT